MRKVTIINDGWRVFYRGNEEEISLPHTFNSFDYERGYFRGRIKYVKELPKAEKRTFLELGAAASFCTVKINGKKVGSHSGGYSPFSFNITNFLNKDVNILTVHVDNSPNKHILSAGYERTNFGGLYRDVKLIELESCGFKADRGVQAQVKKQSGNLWHVNINSIIEDFIAGYKVSYRLFDSEGTEVASVNSEEALTSATLSVQDPVLWDIDTPYLYTLECEITDDIHSVDKVSMDIGFRDIFIDSEKGLWLNGNNIKIRGVIYTQDKLLMGNALTRKELLEDITAIKQMGANSIRLLNQADEKFYDLCNREGILVWADIPCGKSINKNQLESASLTLKNMIADCLHHPCIFAWGICSSPIEKRAGKTALKRIKMLRDMAKELDETRFTSVTLSGDEDVKSPMNGSAELIGYSAHFGWYKATTYELKNKLKAFFAEHPQYKLALSEYGAEGDPNIHIKYPEQGDMSEEYQTLYHERYLKNIHSFDNLWGAYTYMFDYYSPLFCDGINRKGLVSIDRSTFKDAYYLYKAYWNTQPFIHIAGASRERKAGDSKIKVYSNLDKVSLDVNGKIFEISGKKVFDFDKVPIAEGENTVRAYGEDISQETTITGSAEGIQENKAIFSVAKSVLDGVSPIGGTLTVHSKLKDILKSRKAKTVLKCFFDKQKSVELLNLLGLMTLKSYMRLCGYNNDAITLVNAFLLSIKTDLDY